jgi:hypothetical protein
MRTELRFAMRRSHDLLRATYASASRYGLWLAAPLKFILSFSLLIALGSQIQSRKTLTIDQPQIKAALEDLKEA